LVVLALGSYFARFVGDTVASYLRNLKLRDAQLVGKVVQYAIMVFVILVALDQVRIGGDIVRQSFLMILGGIVFALALAFGLGGRHWAADRIEQWWPSDRKDREEGTMASPRSAAVRMGQDQPDRKPPAQ
jgi:protein-S-isoprenylcysteine O-methyltransferase Ste14